MAEDELSGLPVAGDRVRTLREASTQLAFHLERLDSAGIRVLSPFDEAYPRKLIDRLGHAAPPVLHVAGALELLEADGLGVVGSRTISTESEDVARGAAEVAKDLGLTLVSGAAKGTDITAMRAAEELGHPVLGVMADPMDRRLRQPEVRRAIGEDRLMLVTPFKPDAGFSVANAMSRNKLIYAFSKVTLVVASDLGKGGTWTGAKEALHRGYGRVAVWQGAGGGPGNEALVARGGDPVKSMDDLRALLTGAYSRASDGSRRSAVVRRMRSVT